MYRIWLPIALVATLFLVIPPTRAGSLAVRIDDRGHYAVARDATLDAGPRSPAGEALAAAGWTALGLFGGDVQDVARSPIDPSVVLAGTAPDVGNPGNLYRSTDGGATWAPALAAIQVFAVEFAPDGTAYAGTFDGVWKSSNGGAGWTALPLGIGFNDQVVAVTVDPGDADTVWIGIADALGGQPVNVMRSTDGGASWSDVTPPLAQPMECTGIAIHPADSQRIYATFSGNFGGGEIWVSSDGAATWTNRSAGLPNNPLQDVVHDGTRVLVGGGLLFGSQFVGLYASTDDGASWTALHDGTWPLLVVNDVELDPSDPDTIFAATDGAGVNRSSDGGATWETGVGGSGSLALRAVHAPSSSAVFLGASSLGVFRSTDGGDSFAQSTDGIAEVDLFSIDAHPLDPSELAAAFQGANNGGVYTSTDGGQSWQLEPAPPTRYSVVRFAPDGTLYALSTGPSTVAPEGLYRREAGGNWTSLGPDQGGLFESELEAIRFSNNDPNLILLGGNDFGVAGFEATVWRSPDSGQSWSKVYEGTEDGEVVSDLEIQNDGTDSVMLASFFDFGSQPQVGGALRSTDGGLTWAPSSSGLPAEPQGFALCASPVDDRTFFYVDFGGAAAGGLFKTIDGGQTWTGTGYSAPILLDVLCDPRDDQQLYLAQTAPDRVVRSTDQGMSFSFFAENLDDAGAVRQLAFAGGPEPALLLATSTGAYRRTLADPIFADGFESGDTSAWTATNP